MGRPAVFGEVLFDCFPDSHEVMGGAPFNVAWHLAGFGFDPIMLTGVGQDSRGDAILQAMQAWGMDTRGVQSTSYPTGQVSVSFDNAEPQYEIVENQAYDNIEDDSVKQALAHSECSLLYHGSLIARKNSNKRILSDLSNSDLPIFVDVNLRPPWWDFTSVRDMVAAATWVKLNLEEFKTLYLGDTVTEKDLAGSDFLQDMATDIVSNSPMDLMIITQGEKGALCISAQGCEKGLPVPVENIVDTVGAGDAFSSVMIAGIISNWPMHDTLQRALSFASAICQNQGATSKDKHLYQQFVNQWS